MRNDKLKRFVLVVLVAVLMVGESAWAGKVYKNGGSAMTLSGRIELSAGSQGSAPSLINEYRVAARASQEVTP